MTSLFSLGLLVSCTDTKLPKQDEAPLTCPDNSTMNNDDSCVCNTDYYGSISLNAEENAYLGECIHGLEMAISTGDPSYLTNEKDILNALQHELEQLSSTHTAVLSSIYEGEVIYTPSEWSNHIYNNDIENGFTLVQGSDSGYPLAAAGTSNESHYAAFGFNIAVSLHNGQQPSYEDPFSRVINWLVNHDPLQPADVAQVAISAIGWDESTTASYFADRYPQWEIVTCSSSDVTCFEGKDLLILGATSSDTAEVDSIMEHALSHDQNILFLHTETWAENEFGNTVLNHLQMNYGSYGGNYWSADAADWQNVQAMLAQGIIPSLQTMLQHFQAQDYNFDWSGCTEFVGQIDCSETTGFRSEFLAAAQAVKNKGQQLDKNNLQLFSDEKNRVWKLLFLLGDLYRSNITYPLSKTDSDLMPFMQAYYADHSVLYHRDFNAQQPDLGSFTHPIDPQSIEKLSLPTTVTGSSKGGFTAVGYSALPGQTFTIERLDNEPIEAYLFINSHRTGSTREFNDGLYDRPKFLQSPYIRLEPGQEVTITSPYGGMLQLYVPASEQDQSIELQLTNVARHPVLEDGVDREQYVEELKESSFAYTEIRNPYVQIHAKIDMMLQSIEQYDNDLEWFFNDLEYYMIKDTYNLAGFAGDELQLNEDVAAFCDTHEWDCESEDIHSLPSIQHINIDDYSHCGAGCSGNPYDQAWPLEPLGWGESHEIGHNLQRNRLMVHEGRSSEVSNQIFPLHKHSIYYIDTQEALSATRVDYQGSFTILQEAQLQPNPVDYVYEQLWASTGIYDNNSLRMAFYMQLVHCNDDVQHLQSGWDLYTLMYLHERIYSSASLDWDEQKAALGFSEYETQPDISGNDFMLLSSSFVTYKDQRPFFDMWGITYSEKASQQVASYMYPEAGKLFFVNDNANASPLSTPILVDGQGEWPLSQ